MTTYAQKRLLDPEFERRHKVAVAMISAKNKGIIIPAKVCSQCHSTHKVEGHQTVPESSLP